MEKNNLSLVRSDFHKCNFFIFIFHSHYMAQNNSPSIYFGLGWQSGHYAKVSSRLNALDPRESRLTEIYRVSLFLSRGWRILTRGFAEVRRILLSLPILIYIHKYIYIFLNFALCLVAEKAQGKWKKTKSLNFAKPISCIRISSPEFSVLSGSKWLTINWFSILVYFILPYFSCQSNRAFSSSSSSFFLLRLVAG